MAKITPTILIADISGKVCTHSNVYFARRNGSTYTGTICNKRTTPYSEAELANQQKFKKAHAAALQRKNDPKQAAQDLVAFKNQKKYKTLIGYLVAEEYSKLTD